MLGTAFGILTLISVAACQNGRAGYPFGSSDQAHQITTRSQMLEQYGVPDTALRERDHWLYAYNSTSSSGFEVGFWRGGLLGGVGRSHSRVAVLQFRITDEGDVMSVKCLFDGNGNDSSNSPRRTN
jgi:hypothetical protein